MDIESGSDTVKLTVAERNRLHIEAVQYMTDEINQRLQDEYQQQLEMGKVGPSAEDYAAACQLVEHDYGPEQ